MAEQEVRSPINTSGNAERDNAAGRVGMSPLGQSRRADQGGQSHLLGKGIRPLSQREPVMENRDTSRPAPPPIVR
jgi:hypothetical protein